jgi:hypothetical protein
MMAAEFKIYQPSQWAELLLFTVLLYAPVAFAQNDEAATALPSEATVEETSPQATAVTPGQQVEDAYKPQSGLQKLENLPEESQKHLRNQLREVIVQGDQWRPGDEEIDYPYVPSEAAAANLPLQKQEAEAWEELVDGYHVREAEIYRNSSRSGIAAAGAGAANENTGNSEGSATGGSGQGDTGEQAGQQGSGEKGDGQDSDAAQASNDPNGASTAGVSQNALEFLQKNSHRDSPADGGRKISPSVIDGQDDMQTQAVQHSDQERNQVESAVPSQRSSDEADIASTTGTSQNALEYLTKESNPGGHGSDKNPDSLAREVSPHATLTIEDLKNARGVVQPAAADAPTAAVVDEDAVESGKQPP